MDIRDRGRGGQERGQERRRERVGEGGGLSSVDHEISNLLTKLGKRKEGWEFENAMYARCNIAWHRVDSTM